MWGDISGASWDDAVRFCREDFPEYKSDMAAFGSEEELGKLSISVCQLNP